MDIDVSTVVAAANNVTCFSTKDFADAWSRAFAEHRPLAIPVRGSGPPRTMYAIETPDPYLRRTVSLGPIGFYASPGWDGGLERSTLKEILQKLMGLRTKTLVWNVRFDQEPLASGLAALGLKFQRNSTHVLHLGKEHQHLFAGYNATIRNQVRKASRRGVRVRNTSRPEDVRAYYQVHLQAVAHKGNHSFIFPVEFLLELVEMPSNHFLVAECDERIVAGGIFLRDGDSVFYLHAAYDRDYAHLFPSCAVLDQAIRWACEHAVSFFNFGGSGGIASLERFKSFWGAQPELNWAFEWENPFWARVSHLRAALRKNLSSWNA